MTSRLEIPDHKAVKVRIVKVAEECWQVDGIDRDLNWSESCWTFSTWQDAVENWEAFYLCKIKYPTT